MNKRRRFKAKRRRREVAMLAGIARAWRTLQLPPREDDVFEADGLGVLYTQMMSLAEYRQRFERVD